MKIEKQEDTTFKPVVVTLTFESQEELDTINKIMGYNVDIPLHIESEMKSITPRQVKFFTDFMSALHMVTK